MTLKTKSFDSHLCCVLYTGKFYESQLSPYQQLYVTPNCEEHQEMWTVIPKTINPVVTCLLMVSVATLMLVLVMIIYCRYSAQ